MSSVEKIPPPPQAPDPDSCCGSGCVPCIYDYYDDALWKWREKYGDPEKYNEKTVARHGGKDNK